MGRYPGGGDEQYQWLADRGPDRPPVRLGLARCYRRLGRADEAARLLDGLLAEYPTHGETLWERGDLELEQGRPAAAEPCHCARRRPGGRSTGGCTTPWPGAWPAWARADEAAAFDARVKRLDADLARLGEVRDAVMDRPNDAALRCKGGLLFLPAADGEAGRGGAVAAAGLAAGPEVRPLPPAPPWPPKDCSRRPGRDPGVAARKSVFSVTDYS